mmetsp:Transcript_23342/g.78816  ORF Transcript_23342/g.78816 Transcript_23342/m.78816 type:complete len:321 (-) Transcript_23342:25-987(-)
MGELQGHARQRGAARRRAEASPLLGKGQGPRARLAPAQVRRRARRRPARRRRGGRAPRLQEARRAGRRRAAERGGRARETTDFVPDGLLGEHVPLSGRRRPTRPHARGDDAGHGIARGPMRQVRVLRQGPLWGRRQRGVCAVGRAAGEPGRAPQGAAEDGRARPVLRQRRHDHRGHAPRRRRVPRALEKRRRRKRRRAKGRRRGGAFGCQLPAVRHGPHVVGRRSDGVGRRRGVRGHGRIARRRGLKSVEGAPQRARPRLRRRPRLARHLQKHPRARARHRRRRPRMSAKSTNPRAVSTAVQTTVPNSVSRSSTRSSTAA